MILDSPDLNPLLLTHLIVILVLDFDFLLNLLLLHQTILLPLLRSFNPSLHQSLHILLLLLHPIPLMLHRLLLPLPSPPSLFHLLLVLWPLHRPPFPPPPLPFHRLQLPVIIS